PERTAGRVTRRRPSSDLENTTLAAAIALGRQGGALDQPTVGSYLRALSDEYGVLRGLFLAGAHADPEKDALMHELIERYALNPDPDHPVRRAIRTGQTVVPAPVPS